MMEEGLWTCKKLNVEGNMDVNVDRISNLPDKVIQLILSSLKTKEAVRTSLLSRSWRYRWLSVTNLFLSHSAPYMSPKRSRFLDFVDRFFALREPSDDLNTLLLVLYVLADAARINSWLCSAVKHNVQHLVLLLDCIHDETLELPHCLFTCHTLRDIVIVANIYLKLPPSIQFSNLKRLDLQEVIFPEGQSTQQLFSGLPVLEELNLERCGWWNVNNITIGLPLLQTLNILENEEEPDNCRFYIIAKNLKAFRYIGALRNDYCIFDSESLIWGTLALCTDIEESGRQVELAFRVDMLLRGISCLKNLILTSFAFERLTYSKELYACFPVLYKLESLAFLPKGKAINFGCGTIAKFLEKLPCLELLFFQSGIDLSGNHKVGNWTLDPVPSCFSSHLKRIKISQFRATAGELLVVESLLKSAEKLREMDISLHDEFVGGSARETSVLNELRMLPRASINCNIIFS